MKVAIVHDVLSEYGGAERVLQEFLNLYPYSDLFTAYTKSEILDTFFNKLSASRINTSFVQKTPLVGHNTLVQAVCPLIWKFFNFNKYDLVISISFYLACNQIKVPKNKHIQYITCPPRNIYNLMDKRPLQKIVPYTSVIKYFYYKALRSSPYIIVDSNYIQQVLKRLFNIKSHVIYPPVKVPRSNPVRKNLKYFIIVSRLDRAKYIELAIEACNFLKLPLKIVGKPNDLYYGNYLKKIAGPTIEFLGTRTDAEVNELYKHAFSFLFTAKAEDFGIAPLEAIAHGVPVIAYYGGGTKETLIHKKTGLFFYQHCTKSLISTIEIFMNHYKYNYLYLYNYSKKFSDKRFKEEISAYVDSVVVKK